ncbi:MAG: RNA-directed DNA polymerase [Acidimicrobiia bacterium]
MGRSRGDGWVQALDFNRALKNCHLDFIGDWYRDPWGWFELDWCVREAISEVVEPHVRGSGVFEVARLDVPKENFSVRPAVVIDPLDRLCYQAVVDRLSSRLIGSLAGWAYGWRLSRKRPRAGYWLSQGREWERYRSRLKWLATWYRAALKTDIVSFFSSVPIDRLSEDILQLAGSGVGRRLVDMLAGFDAVHGRSGIPQRSAASAVLAHFYLMSLDEVLGSHAQARGLAATMFSEGRLVRWMDDIWIFGATAGPLRKTQVDVELALRDLGLDMNIGKTDVVEGDRVWEEANRVEHSAVDGGFESDPPDETPLNELVDRLLTRPEHADRTSVKFATQRMRKHESFSRVGDFVDNASRMPHASDALARLFRDSSAWRDLQDWYVDYCRTSWACVDWSTAQFGTMFPSSDPGTGVVRDFLAERVDDESLAVAALASQRLASWDSDTARQAIREAAKTANHPLHRRILALAALIAGEKRAFIRGLLREFRQNDLTLRALEAMNFRRPRAKADFQGG